MRIGACFVRVLCMHCKHLCHLLCSDREGLIVLSRSCCHASLSFSTNQNSARGRDVMPVGYGVRGG